MSGRSLALAVVKVCDTSAPDPDRGTQPLHRSWYTCHRARRINPSGERGSPLKPPFVQQSLSQRTKRRFVKVDQVLEKLAVGRRGAIQVSTEAKIASPEYRAAQSALNAIDNLAEVLTGDQEHFHLKPARADQMK